MLGTFLYDVVVEDSMIFTRLFRYCSIVFTIGNGRKREGRVQTRSWTVLIV